MKKDFKNLKGTFDYLPKKQLIREEIKQTLQQVFVKYGFAPVETPILCMYELLASKYSEGADILNETYKLSDQGKRELGLRYDLTITFAKLISSNPQLTLPFKRYEMGKVFRDGPVKLGRNREFTQCDVDCVGISGLLAEAEYLEMTAEVYDRLGLDIVIEFNNRKLLSGLLEVVCGALTGEQTAAYILLIDKFAKMSRAEFNAEFARLGLDEAKVEALMELLQSDLAGLKSKLVNYPANEKVAVGLAEVEELLSYLKGHRAEAKAVFAPYLARGIEIYTGTVWEIFMKNREISSSIGAGGRYDKIITEFIDDGREYPAIGMTFGLDVIYEAILATRENAEQPLVDVYVIPMGTKVESFDLVTKLRAEGLRVDMEKNDVKLKKSMNYANKTEIPYVIILGENEIADRRLMLKEMATGEQTAFGFDELAELATKVRG
ncbi:MAG: histidine--tRNA ligase [Lachnospiraceae bacterium]|nr:histidine--tRNA ligase [Lachnospiraceae bacterium]MDY5741426.1 histidine--tRNA ligase [Lachnospiraceae bacterium]